MTVYIFRIELPVEIPEDELRREIKKMMDELIAQGTVTFKVTTKYKYNRYNVETNYGWGDHWEE